MSTSQRPMARTRFSRCSSSRSRIPQFQTPAWFGWRCFSLWQHPQHHLSSTRLETSGCSVPVGGSRHWPHPQHHRPRFPPTHPPTHPSNQPTNQPPNHPTTHSTTPLISLNLTTPTHPPRPTPPPRLQRLPAVPPASRRLRSARARPAVGLVQPGRDGAPVGRKPIISGSKNEPYGCGCQR